MNTVFTVNKYDDYNFRDSVENHIICSVCDDIFYNVHNFYVASYIIFLLHKHYDVSFIH